MDTYANVKEWCSKMAEVQGSNPAPTISEKTSTSWAGFQGGPEVKVRGFLQDPSPEVLPFWISFLISFLIV